jgi:signal transduction histidine kinase
MPARNENELLAYLSHELRTGLHAMVGHAQLLQLGQLPAEDATSVERIIDMGFYLVGLLEEVSEIAVAELSDSEHVKLEPVAIGPVLEQLAALTGPLAGERGARIEIAPVAAGAELVMADRRRLTQILLNLISNAIKYGGADGVVRLSAERVDGRVVVAVADSGPGIDAGRLQDLFEPFARLGAEAGPAPGSGIGLALSRRIARMTDAELALESSDEQGSTFTLSLTPAADAAQRPVAK